MCERHGAIPAEVAPQPISQPEQPALEGPFPQPTLSAQLGALLEDMQLPSTTPPFDPFKSLGDFSRRNGLTSEQADAIIDVLLNGKPRMLGFIDLNTLERSWLSELNGLLSRTQIDQLTADLEERKRAINALNDKKD